MGSLRSLRQKTPTLSVAKQYPYKFVGSKYDPDLDVVEIAKRVRKDLKREYSECKFSVRIQRFSMGRSLDVTIKHTDFQVVNPDWVRFRVENPEWDHAKTNAPELYTADGEALFKRVKEIVQAYNFDDSDSMSDYYHVNFSQKIVFDHDLDGLIERQEIETAQRLGLPIDGFLAEKEELHRIFQKKRIFGLP
jgi:hypothetical protein